MKERKKSPSRVFVKGEDFMDQTKVIFGNPMDAKTIAKAERSKRKFIKKFGAETGKTYFLQATENPVLGEVCQVSNLTLAEEPMVFPENAFIVGNIRMGFGHYRIAMAIASCANALGFKPYWFDLTSFHGTTGSEMIKQQNALYSMGSKLSQRSRLFNHFVWEPLNSEGFRKLTYNAIDQKNAELLVPLYYNLPKGIPFAGTHVWAAQGAVHSGLEHVGNVIPDNWPMGLHLSEGSVHTVQTPFAYLGYKRLHGMAKNTLKGMPEGTLVETGHYVDHELVHHLPEDTARRLKRLEEKKPLRILVPVGGAGAGKTLLRDLLLHLLPRMKKKEVQILLNFGDHLDIWNYLKKEIPELMKYTRTHFDDYSGCLRMIENEDVYEEPVQAFYHQDIFQAVYSTNLLMREADLLITKPSELSFYPIPKLFMKRVGGHEAYGALYSSQIGDGTMECGNKDELNDMMDALLDVPELLQRMNEQILTLHERKVYHGGYEVVKLLTTK